MVNIDPTTTERDPAILRAIAAERDSCLGVYGTTVRPGRSWSATPSSSTPRPERPLRLPEGELAAR